VVVGEQDGVLLRFEARDLGEEVERGVHGRLDEARPCDGGRVEDGEVEDVGHEADRSGGPEKRPRSGRRCRNAGNLPVVHASAALFTPAVTSWRRPSRSSRTRSARAARAGLWVTTTKACSCAE